MKNLRLITLLFGLTLALPAPQIKAAGPADNNNFGWIMAGAALAGVIWWNVWGKNWVKKGSEEAKATEKRECCLCRIPYKNCDMVTLHPNTREHIRNNLPDIDMSARPAYERQNNELNRARMRELPKKT